jgi:hypothetical protein
MPETMETTRLVFTSQEIGEILAGKKTEVRLPIDEPPIWEKDDIVPIYRQNEGKPVSKTKAFIKVVGFDVVTDFEEGEQWVLWFQSSPSPHSPRLLTYAARPKSSEKGYTHLPGYAMKGEPEALSEAEQAVRSKERREKYGYFLAQLTKERKAYLRTLDFETRIQLATEAAKANNIDIRSNRKTVKKLIASGRPESVIVQNIMIMERRAHRWPK